MAVCVLGCGEYRAVVVGRCGSPQVCELDGISIMDGTPFRVLDDTSQVQFTVDLSGQADGACCECLGNVHSWIHALMVYRDGELVWGPGPITNVLLKREQAVITARDVSAWLDVRVLHNSYNFVNESVTTIARTLIQDAMAPDDPCDIAGKVDIAEPAVPTRITKSYTANEGYVGDLLRDLAKTVLDFTVIGQSIYIRESISFGPYTRLTDEDFTSELEVEERGLETATKWYVKGSAVIGTAGGTDTFYGLIEQLASDDSITDTAHANAAAAGRLTASNPAPLYINVPSDSQLSVDAPVCFEQLVPGTLVDLVLVGYCREIFTRFRLTAMSVKVDSSGNENVGITLSPLGTGFYQGAVTNTTGVGPTG